MNLILQTRDREIPCIDWPTAIAGLHSVPGAIAVLRSDRTDNKVWRVFWPWAHYDRRDGVWLSVSIGLTSESLHVPESGNNPHYLAKLMAGEDV